MTSRTVKVLTHGEELKTEESDLVKEGKLHEIVSTEQCYDFYVMHSLDTI